MLDCRIFGLLQKNIEWEFLTLMLYDMLHDTEYVSVKYKKKYKKLKSIIK